jgi:hypothetical protein
VNTTRIWLTDGGLVLALVGVLVLLPALIALGVRLSRD